MKPIFRLMAGVIFKAAFAAIVVTGSAWILTQPLPRHAERKPQTVRIHEIYGKLPLAFEVNDGQTDSQVKFLPRGKGYALFLTPDEAVLSLRKQPLRIRFLGGNPAPEVEGMDPLPGKSNYFIGNDPKQWRTGSSCMRQDYSLDVSKRLGV
jgi:hypothetical protein